MIIISTWKIFQIKSKIIRIHWKRTVETIDRRFTTTPSIILKNIQVRKQITGSDFRRTWSETNPVRTLSGQRTDVRSQYQFNNTNTPIESHSRLMNLSRFIIFLGFHNKYTYNYTKPFELRSVYILDLHFLTACFFRSVKLWCISIHICITRLLGLIK